MELFGLPNTFGGMNVINGEATTTANELHSHI
jgi:hypothetical protein